MEEETEDGKELLKSAKHAMVPLLDVNVLIQINYELIIKVKRWSIYGRATKWYNLKIK